MNEAANVEGWGLVLGVGGCRAAELAPRIWRLGRPSSRENDITGMATLIQEKGERCIHV